VTTMRLRSRLLPRPRLVAALVAGVLATAGARAADAPDKLPADPPKHPVTDPHYDNMLF